MQEEQGYTINCAPPIILLSCAEVQQFRFILLPENNASLDMSPISLSSFMASFSEIFTRPQKPVARERGLSICLEGSESRFEASYLELSA